MLNIIDEFTGECLSIRIGRKLKAIDVINALSDLFIVRGVLGHTFSQIVDVNPDATTVTRFFGTSPMGTLK